MDMLIRSEGEALNAIGSHHSTEAGCAHVRSIVDGYVNALIRAQGAEKTAAFLFQLADRAAGGVRSHTDFKLPVAPPKPEGDG